jgi:DNA helicase HerA-like ATPase
MPLIAPFLTVVEEAQNYIPSTREGTEETPSLSTLRKVITEGRKLGVGLILITQRPSRVDETILAQCNSFLVMRLVNPKDQTYVRSVMENLPESDARMLPGFGPGQGQDKIPFAAEAGLWRRAGRLVVGARDERRGASEGGNE